MSLSLPADLEPYLTDGFEQMRQPAVYVLDLERPDNLAEKWDDRFETRPEWFPEFRDSSAVIYVGATSDVLRRLEEHRDGNVRRAVLCEICDVSGIRAIHWFQSQDRAFERESGIAISIQNANPSKYIHCR